MKYFELSTSTDTRITGTIPQVRFPEIVGRDESCDDLIEYVRHPDPALRFRGRKQLGSAYTDLMSCAGISVGKGLLVSEKLYQLSAQLECADCEPYTFHIHDSETGGVTAYRYLHVIPCRVLENAIDYEKSLFVTENRTATDIVKVTSWQNWCDRNVAQVVELRNVIQAKRLHLTTLRSFPCILRLPFLATILISGEIIEKMSKAGISGAVACSEATLEIVAVDC